MMTFAESNPVLDCGFWYWCNDSYVRLKRMDYETARTGLQPRKLVGDFIMEYYMTKPQAVRRKRKYSEI